MTHIDTVALASWSALTAICMIVVGFAYIRFTGHKKNEPSPS